jgi:hypothetical protein
MTQAARGEMEGRLSVLIRKFGIVSVTRYLDATSKLIAIADLGKIDVAGSGASSASLDNLTAFLEGMKPRDFKILSSLSKQERSNLEALIREYGKNAVAELLSLRLSQSQVDLFKRISDSDPKAFAKLATAYANADRDTQTTILAKVAEATKPHCFGGRLVLDIIELPGGYQVSPLTADLVPEIGTGSRFISNREFDAFGSKLSRNHSQCYIDIRQHSQTNDESQYRTIEGYFWPH